MKQRTPLGPLQSYVLAMFSPKYNNRLTLLASGAAHESPHGVFCRNHGVGCACEFKRETHLLHGYRPGRWERAHFLSLKAVPAGVHEADLPHRVVILWRYETDLNGMPDADANSAQIALEDALLPLDMNEMGRQMLVVTGNNRKEWLWYVKDFDSWIAQLNKRLTTSPAYPIDISHSY